MRKFMVLFMFVVVLAACTGAPAELPEATFVGTEYAYEGPDSIPGGWTRINFDNQGEQPHDLMLMQLMDGKTMDDVMAEKLMTAFRMLEAIGTVFSRMRTILIRLPSAATPGAAARHP